MEISGYFDLGVKWNMGGSLIVIKERNKGIKRFWKGLLKEIEGGNEYEPLFPLILPAGLRWVSGS